MRTLIKTLIATSMASTALLGFSVAQAADAVDQIPEAPAAVEMAQPAGDWSGAYLGGAGTYNFGRFNKGDYDARQLGGQVYGGYNMQNGQIVYGAEADIGYSGNDDVNNGIRSKQRVNGSIRGRVGYDLNPVLVYGTAGVAVQQSKASDATSSDKRTAAGLTVGADAMQRQAGLPASVIFIVQSLIILFVLASDILRYYRISRVGPAKTTPVEVGG